MQNRLVAGATVLIVFIVVLAIVATVLVLRTKNQDDLDKKTSNHLPLPLDYASNEGTCLELWSNVPTLKFLLKSIYLLFSHFYLLFEIQSYKIIFFLPLFHEQKKIFLNKLNYLLCCTKSCPSGISS